MHSEEIIERYEAKEAEFKHRAILININRTATERGVCEVVRYAWKLDPKKAGKAELVLAVKQCLIVGVFVADKWLKATPESFPGTPDERSGRWGFVGHEANKDIADSYRRHRVPDSMRKRGAANPIK